MNNRSVSKGDSVYFQSKHGPKSGVVLSHGEHGLSVDSDGQTHKVYWKHLLGHKQRLQHKMSLVEKGEDGAIVKNEKGDHSYIAGEMPEAAGYLDKISSLDENSEGDLITRRIERELEQVTRYMVVDARSLDDGNVLVIESVKTSPLLLKHLEDNKLQIDYDAFNMVKADGDKEESLVLIQFTVEDDQLQNLVNAVAIFQRKKSTDNEMIIVRGREVKGMQSATMAIKSISGRSVFYFDQKADEEVSENVSVSNDLVDLMMKSNSLVIFKSSTVNRQGPVLDNSSDVKHEIETEDDDIVDSSDQSSASAEVFPEQSEEEEELATSVGGENSEGQIEENEQDELSPEPLEVKDNDESIEKKSKPKLRKSIAGFFSRMFSRSGGNPQEKASKPVLVVFKSGKND